MADATLFSMTPEERQMAKILADLPPSALRAGGIGRSGRMFIKGLGEIANSRPIRMISATHSRQLHGWWKRLQEENNAPHRVESWRARNGLRVERKRLAMNAQGVA